MKSAFPTHVRRFAALPLVLAAFTLAACDDDDDSTTPPDPVEWEAELEGAGEFEEVTGVAAVLSTQSKFEATIEIQGAPADATFAWTVAAGSCAQPGNAVGAANAYPDLEVGEDGTAEAEAEVTAALNASGNYIVHVIDDSGDEPVTVACGALAKQD